MSWRRPINKIGKRLDSGSDAEVDVRYAIIGATGSVGQPLTKALLNTGHTVKVLGRDAAKVRAVFGDAPTCEAIQWDNPEQAAQALREVDTAFYVVGVPYTNFGLHPKLMAVALAAARNAGVKRFVHVSTVYPYGRPQRARVDESHPREPTAFKGRMRKAQEDLVFEAHTQTGMQTLVARPPDFYGPTSEASYVRDIFDAALAGRAANVIGPVDTPHDFIFVPDLVRALVLLSDKEEAYGRAWNVNGAGPMTTQAFAELVFAAAGTRCRLRAAGGIVLRIAGLFNAMMREILEMHYLWTTPVLLDDKAFRALFPEYVSTPHEEAIRITVETMRLSRSQH